MLMVYISYQEFITTPLVTSVETDSQKTTEIVFPGMKIKLFPRIFMCACNLFIKIYLIFDSSAKQFISICFAVNKIFLWYISH